MTSIRNANIRVQNQPPVIVENIPNNVRRVNFKAENDSFTRQQNGPVYTQPPMFDQQAAMRKAIEDQKKAQKKQKMKSTALSTLSIAVSVVMLAYFGKLLHNQHLESKAQKLTAEALQNGQKSIHDIIKNCPDEKIKRAMAEEINKGYGFSMKKINALDTLANIETREAKLFDIDKAKRILDEEVIGMEDAKEQIINHLKFRNYCIENGIQLDTPFVLALDGPAGTAKTTLANAVAKACDMPHKEISMAGMTGKAPIKGSEPVYSGSTWGEIADAQIEHKTKSIVYTLDEIEKTGSSEHNGKAEDALLSLMDNRHFVTDDYLGVDIDVMDSIIITTSNNYEKLSEPMKSRLSKVVRIKPYTDEVKKSIAEFKMKHFMKKYKMTDKMNINDDALETLVLRHKSKQGGREISNEVESLMESITISPEFQAATKENPFVLTGEFVNRSLIKLAE